MAQYKDGGDISSASSEFHSSDNRDNTLSNFARIALSSGFLTRDSLEVAIQKCRIWGGSLPDTLISMGLMKAIDVARLRSSEHRVPFLNLEREPCHPDLLQPDDIDFYLTAMCLPWRRWNGETIYVAANPAHAHTHLKSREANPYRIFVTSRRDIHQAIIHHFSDKLTEKAIYELEQKTPENSSSIRLSHAQLLGFSILTALLVPALWYESGKVLAFLGVSTGIIFLVSSILKYASIFVGLLTRPSREELAFATSGAPPDHALPTYTVMVPLFRETRVLPILSEALLKIDYPSSKLDIKYLFEESDLETFEAAKALNLPDHFEFIIVPDSSPQTKPKACNFALPFARGEFLVIYDAEDMPEPNQLKKAVAAFNLGDEKLACVQAQLNYYNWNENWLTRQFSIEYAAFFDLLLPTLVRLGIPIPLGGTSTHFRTSILRDAGAWDPNNVTEDADLGLRLAMQGYRCGIIQSTTQEEANCHLPNWIRQRSRWIKGWLQTYLVRMRHPVRLLNTLGLRGFIGFQIVIGGFTLSNLIHPVFYLAALGLIFNGHAPAGYAQGKGLLGFYIFVLCSGYSLSIAAGLVAAAARGRPQLFLSAFMMPFYWILISIAGYKAIWQLFTRPFHWEKTEHGLSRMMPSFLPPPAPPPSH